MAVPLGDCGVPVYGRVCVCYGGQSTDGPISWWKVQAPNPSWRARAITGTQDGGGGQGHRRMKKREEGVGQGQFQGGPHPQGESRTVYPDIPAAAESQGCFQDSAAKVSWNSSAQRHMLGSLLREISFLGKLKQRNFLCGQTELPDLKASWKGNSFIMKWQIKDIPAGFTSKQLLRVQAKPYYTPSQNKNKPHPDRFLYAGLYPSPRTFLHSLLPLPSSHPRH